MTNNIGPEKFQRCASQWIGRDKVEPETEGTCIKAKPPPIDDFCTKYKKEIEKLRFVYTLLFKSNFNMVCICNLQSTFISKLDFITLY